MGNFWQDYEFIPLMLGPFLLLIPFLLFLVLAAALGSLARWIDKMFRK